MSTVTTSKDWLRKGNQYHNPRIVEDSTSNAFDGRVSLSLTKAAWVVGLYLVAIIGGVLTFSWDALVVFLISTAVTLCLGHSLGMHRLLIHRSYECPKWLEYFLVHLGVLVGLAGPRGMMHTHDMRDWAQRQEKCHDYFAHQQPMAIDGLWQLLFDVHLDHSPHFKPEVEFEQDRVYQWMEKTWMWQQLPWAILLFVCGGLTWVIWGIAVRVAVSITGHWLIGYFAHNEGERDWHVKGAAVQGFNIKFASLITMGESWHNNHHAYPGSALLGIKEGQLDPGWWVLKGLSILKLVWNIRLPADLPQREELVRVMNRKQIMKWSQQ
ncbi:acyl-CoA desaturase [Pleionea sediminis]|uniref:acyl-CoA desaturase n=1 Tax=Pleionea sediminis TaxID=2569479 RepID=UPI0011853F12|nr:acyl-CoA desaturase [Pleionea sediminis]